MGNQHERREAFQQAVREAESQCRAAEREKDAERQQFIDRLGIGESEPQSGRRARSISSAKGYVPFYKELLHGLDRKEVLEAQGIRYEDMGKYLQFDCPQCHTRTAYLYKKGDKLVCNGRNKCRFSQSLPALVLGLDHHPRGQQFQKGVRELAKIANVPMPRNLDDPAVIQAHKELDAKSRAYELVFAASQSRLQAGDENAAAARTYLHEHRGFPLEYVDLHFGLYDHDAVKKALVAHPQVESVGHANAFCLNVLGLSERFEGYIVFSYRDIDGFTRGLLSRYPQDPPPEDKVKSLTPNGLSKDTPFLLYESLVAGNLKKLVIVEGVFDAHLAHAHGVTNTVAMMGASLSLKQAQVLRATGIPRATLSLDQDVAGREGTLKTVRQLNKVGIDAFVAEELHYRDPNSGDVRLAKDPAELIKRAGHEEFERCLEFAQHHLSYQAEKLVGSVDGEWTPEKIHSLMGDAQQLVAGAEDEEASLYFWSVLKDSVMDSAGLTSEEFEQLRATTDPQIKLRQAKPKIEKFVKRVQNLESVGRQKVELAKALSDEKLCEALGVAEAFEPGWLDQALVEVSCTHGLGGRVQKLIGHARKVGAQIKTAWQFKINPPLENDSHVTLAEESLRELTDVRENLKADLGQLHLYNGTYWRELLKHEVVQAIQRQDGRPVEFHTRKGTKARPLKLRSSDIKGIREQIAFLPSVAHPGFFDGAPHGVQFADLFVQLLDDGKLRIEPPARKHRQRAAYEFDYDPDASCPMWLAALRAWFRGDADAKLKIQFLQEITGCYLFGLATLFELCLLLFGKGGNGKSVFLTIIKAAFPDGSTCAVDPQVFEDDAKLVLLEGKLLNVSADIPAAEILDSSVFKRVISGDPTTARRLYQDAYEFRPRAGHLFACNELPRSRDLSNGFYDRVAVISFNNDFRTNAKKRKTNLADDIIENELPGVVAWMVEGAQRLMKRGKFVIPPSALEMREDWRESSNPVAQWVREETHPVKPHAGETMRQAIKARGTRGSDLYLMFKGWAQENGFRSMTSRTFGERLKHLAQRESYSDANRYALSLVPAEAPEGVEEGPEEDSQ